MAQTFTSTEVVTTTNVFADNQSQRTNENTLRSSFSGATQPSDPVVGQVWYDTANSKQMQYNGTSWVSIDTNGTTQKDVTNAKGNLTSLTDYLRVSHNDDGTLKTSPATAIDEFKDNALAITYVSTSSFTVPTDLTSIFTTNRKVKVYLDGSTVISYVVSSSYSSGDNKTTVVLGGTVLDSSVTAVKYSIIQYGERQDTVHSDSPVFTGTPTAPTAPSGTSTTQLATTEFVSNAMGTGTAVVPNNISSGRKVTSVSGLTVNLSAGTSVINNITKGFSSGPVDLPARKACLIVDKSDGTTGYIEGVYPDAIASTVHRWVIDGTSPVASTVGTNNLTSTGSITQSDGWLGYSVLGAGGHYTGANSTNIPAYSSAFTCRILVKFISNGAAQCFYHDGPRKIACNSSNYLLVGGVSTNFVMTSGQTYVIEVKGAGNTTIGNVFLNGSNIFPSGTVVINTAVTVPYVLSNNAAGETSVSSVEYIELFNSSISINATGSASNKLIIPCFYTDTSSARRSIISDVLSSNETVVAFCKTNGTTVTDYNDLWYCYGRREGSTAGNRRMFLSWQPFSAAQSLKWTNPFGTGKYKKEIHWAADNKGTNEIICPGFYRAGESVYGALPTAGTTGYNDAQNITVATGIAGVADLNDTWQTSGYIGVYAEVLEDYVGVV